MTEKVPLIIIMVVMITIMVILMVMMTKNIQISLVLTKNVPILRNIYLVKKGQKIRAMPERKRAKSFYVFPYGHGITKST